MQKNNSFSTSIQIALFVLIFIICIYLQNLLLPLIFGFILANLLFPIVKQIQKTTKLPTFYAAFLSILLLMIFITGLIFLLANQINSIIKDFPAFYENITTNINTLSTSLETILPFDFKHINLNDYFNYKQLISIFPFSNLSSIFLNLFNLILIPIYALLILSYKSNLVQFVTYKKENHEALLIKINRIIQTYMKAIFFEMLTVFLLASISLWALGIKYAFLIGIITCFLNIIPYIGILISFLIALTIGFIGSTNLYLLIGISIIYLCIQQIDSNFLLPKLVGSKLRINVLASMLGIIFGGYFFGISGMFLALPLLGIAKVIFDFFPEYTRFSKLISET